MMMMSMLHSSLTTIVHLLHEGTRGLSERVSNDVNGGFSLAFFLRGQGYVRHLLARVEQGIPVGWRNFAREIRRINDTRQTARAVPRIKVA